MLKIIISLSEEKRLQYLKERLAACGSAVLVVPEQSLFETERSMYGLLGARKIASTVITGFSKLAADIISKYGTPKLYADDIVKTVTMYKTLSRLKKTAVSPSESEVRRMLDVASVLKAAAITPEVVSEKSADLISDDFVLSDKLAALAEVYSTYCNMLDVDFADRLDDIRIAAELLNRFSSNGADIIVGRDVFVNEFDGFSGSQFNLLKALVQSGAESVSVILRTDAEVSEGEEFFAVNSLIKRLKRELSGVPYELVDLEGAAFTPETQLWLADGVYDECEFVAAEIRRLITNEDYICNQIAVLVCDSAVTPRLKEAMNEYDIRAFTDLPEPIIGKPMTRFIISALEAVSLNTPELMTYIRSGFVRVPAELERFNLPRRLTVNNSRERERERRYEFAGGGRCITKRLSKRSMDSLEGAAYRYALTKCEWRSAFPAQNKDLAAKEQLRRAVVQPLTEFGESCRNATGADITEALCEFLLETMQLQRTVLGLCNGFEQNEQKSVTDEFRQLWDLVIDVFESLHSSLTDFPMSLREYTELLKGIFSSVNIAKPPSVLDEVVIGDLERSRLSKMRVTFIIGATSGKFPKSASNSSLSESGVFSWRETEELAENGLELLPNLEERYNYERFMMNKALTIPSEKLYITAPLTGLSWEELIPSSIFDEEGRTVNEIAALPLSFRVRTARSARRLLSTQVFDNAEKSEQLLSAPTAKQLLGLEKLSPTAIETMMSCRFKFFCKYGLGLTVPLAQNEDEPVATERGNIIHYCLDRVLRKDGLLGSDSELSAFIETCIDEYREQRLPRGYAQTKRQAYILMSYKVGIMRMVKHIRDELTQSGWRPIEFEKKIDLSLGGLHLTGKIDRVDKFGDYIRVTDYKSGSAKMYFPSLFNGLDMQMLLYAYAAEKEHNRQLSSALYLPSDGVKTKDILLPDASPADREKSWLSAHTPSGVMINEEPKGSTVALRSMTPAAYKRLKAYTIKLINKQFERVKRGNIRAVPVSRTTTDCETCEYCDFASVCEKSGVKLIKKEYIERIAGNEDKNMD
ncbi:MAG: PD-(D/E)XK nuclease family protein [Oscillospiraceae bacterium]|nr:PD-(D/E)XK nuclease family protein [Oscillospiraceae bacterium]